jgi:hypothetical protein
MFLYLDGRSSDPAARQAAKMPALMGLGMMISFRGPVSACGLKEDRGVIALLLFRVGSALPADGLRPGTRYYSIAQAVLATSHEFRG